MHRYLNNVLFWTYYFDIEHIAKDLGFSDDRSEKFFDDFVGNEDIEKEYLRLELDNHFEFRMKYDSEFILYIYHPDFQRTSPSEYLDFSLGLPLGCYGSFTYLPALSLLETSQLIAASRKAKTNFNIQFLPLLLLPFCQDKNLDTTFINKAIDHAGLFNERQRGIIRDELQEVFITNQQTDHWVEDQNAGVIWNGTQSLQSSLRNPKTKIWLNQDFELCKRFMKSIRINDLTPS